ncbi:hypothetical protein [Campylobacter sp. MG1]|uniref:hypothetical protein n=1 Tax=Campylobacter sp. MG1 TaxID=2976332 RepID=UPI00226D2A07|nr:hypothetical protein [Campylobacter sp. MG1]
MLTILFWIWACAGWLPAIIGWGILYAIYWALDKGVDMLLQALPYIIGLILLAALADLIEAKNKKKEANANNTTQQRKKPSKKAINKWIEQQIDAGTAELLRKNPNLTEEQINHARAKAREHLINELRKNGEDI